MAERVQKQKPAPQEREAEPKAELPSRTPEQQEAIDKADDLLDEIDEALQGLDNELATTFHQKGGE
jgi:sugar-specific transcriptional regulator TrmB